MSSAGVLTRPRDATLIANDVAEMRRAIALEKGEDDIWDLKYAAGGMVDIDFIAQYLQLVHAADKPDILSVNTQQVLDNAQRLGVLSLPDAEILRPAARLYHDLTQILRLCVSDKFKPETAGDDLLRVMARAGDAPDFSALEARVRGDAGRCARRVSQADGEAITLSGGADGGVLLAAMTGQVHANRGARSERRAQSASSRRAG